MKRISFLVILTLLSIFIIISLTACDTVEVIPTGIVTITLEIEPMFVIGIDRPEKSYYIYMDDEFLGTMPASGALTIEEVSLGTHLFRATDHATMMVSSHLRQENDLYEKPNGLICWGMIEYEVQEGINYVKIPVSCGYMVEIEM